LGGVAIVIIPNPDSPREGENELEISLRRPDGSPWDGAGLRVVASMPAMGSMPYMESKATVRGEGRGVYRASYFLSMAGEWDLRLLAAAPNGRELRGHWRIRIGTAGLRYISDELSASDHAGSATTAAGGPESPSDSLLRAGRGESGPRPSVWIDPATYDRLGIRIATLQPHFLVASCFVTGRVAYDETRTADVAMRFSGRVRRISAVQAGTAVRSNDTLCWVYSPEMIAAEQDFLNTVNNARARGGDPYTHGDAVFEMISAARKRLEGWDLSNACIDSILTTNRIILEVPIVAPVSGVVTRKSVVRGSYFAAGDVLFRVAPADPVRVIAELPDAKRSFAVVGSRVQIRDRAEPDREWTGGVETVGAELDEQTRTLPVSIKCRNPRGDLLPGAFVEVTLSRSMGSALGLPEAAVLHARGQSWACVQTGAGEFELREVELGIPAGVEVEVLRGLVPGDRVVIEGQVVIASQLHLMYGEP
jgi:Cu(I)/Ag(I) efflux system membrane fusion protein